MEYRKSYQQPMEKKHPYANVTPVDLASSGLLDRTGSGHQQPQSLPQLHSQLRTNSRSLKTIYKLRGWRMSILIGLLTTLVVAIVNIAILAWVYSSLEIKNGSAIAYTGNKAGMKRISTWSHLAINILSSILLAASNNAMQCLAAPTREEVDKAHSEGSWLQIGIPGMRNLFNVNGRRTLLWFLFLCSSLPVHLLYNSVIYDTLGSNDYIVAYVAPEFVTGGPWYPSHYLDYRGANMSSFTKYQQIPNDLVRLEKEDCIRAYGTPYNQNWADVLVVMDRHDTVDTMYDMETSVLAWNGSPFPRWVCGTLDYRSICDQQTALQMAGSWQRDIYPNHTEVSLFYHELVDVSYCLAQPAAAESYLEISPSILIGVIVCNIIKIICFALTLVYALGDHDPLITTGDAVQSFLRSADTRATGNSILSAKDVKSGRWKTNNASNIWQPKRRFWFSAPSAIRWTSLSLLVSIFWACGIVLLIYGIHNIGSGNYTKGLAQIPFNYLTNLGFGEPIPATTITQSTVGMFQLNFQNVNKNIIISNLPQLALSISYFLYNGTWTTILTMKEWTSYAFISQSKSRAKGLRVSNPQGGQRSTIYLQLPYTYSIPLLTAAALMHYFLSRSLFITRINSRGLMQYNITGDPDRTVDALGWSPVPLICTLILAFTMMLALWISGFRRYTDKIPLSATNSLSIAAACQKRPDDDGEELVLRGLVFGDVGCLRSETGVDGLGNDGQEVIGEARHATFVADLDCVTPLMPGKTYR